MDKKRWHTAFFQAIQMVLDDYRDVLEFVAEYQLTTESLRADVIIIKKQPGIVIDKSIAEIFRDVNIIEYKSPDDYASVSVFRKVQAYGWLYSSLDDIAPHDMTLSIVVMNRPVKLLDYLQQEYRVELRQPGIYVVKGTNIITQIIIESDLDEDAYILLQGLKNEQLEKEKIQRIFQDIARINRREQAEAYLDVFVNVNKQPIEELTMLATTMEVFEEIGVAAIFEARGEKKGRADGKAEGEAEGRVLSILCFLKARFGILPEHLPKKVYQVTNLSQLDELTSQAALCASLEEFETHLN